MKFLVFFLYGCNFLFPPSRVGRKHGTQRTAMVWYGRTTVRCNCRQLLKRNVVPAHAIKAYGAVEV